TDGGEFRVNADTDMDQIDPAVTMDGGGDFIVAWNDWGTPFTRGPGIYARRFESSGGPRGDAFLVSAEAEERRAPPPPPPLRVERRPPRRRLPRQRRSGREAAPHPRCGRGRPGRPGRRVVGVR